MDDSTLAKADSLEHAEERLAQAERTVDDSTRVVIDRNRHISTILSEIQQRMSDVDWAMSDYLSAAVTTGVATELYKSRTSDCAAAESLLEHVNARQVEVFKARDRLKRQYEKRRESYTSSQEETRLVKSLLMKQEIDWTGAKADYYNARLQASLAADHLKTCEEALSRARLRLEAADSESRQARSNVDDIESSMAELIEKANRMSRKLASRYNDLMDIMSQSQHSEMTYLAAEQSAHHVQKDIDQFMSEQSELQKQLEAAKRLEKETSQTAKTLREELQDLSSRSVDEFEQERRARLDLRKAEKEVFRASRERNQEYLNRTLEAHREQEVHHKRESSTRTTLMLVGLICVVALALMIGQAIEGRTVPLASDALIALSCLLLGSLAARISISERSWPRWLQRTRELRKNGRSWLRRSWFTRGTRSK